MGGGPPKVTHSERQKIEEEMAVALAFRGVFFLALVAVVRSTCVVFLEVAGVDARPPIAFFDSNERCNAVLAE